MFHLFWRLEKFSSFPIRLFNCSLFFPNADRRRVTFSLIEKSTPDWFFSHLFKYWGQPAGISLFLERFDYVSREFITSLNWYSFFFVAIPIKMNDSSSMSSGYILATLPLWLFQYASAEKVENHVIESRDMESKNSIRYGAGTFTFYLLASSLAKKNGHTKRKEKKMETTSWRQRRVSSTQTHRIAITTAGWLTK